MAKTLLEQYQEDLNLSDYHLMQACGVNHNTLHRIKQRIGVPSLKSYYKLMVFFSTNLKRNRILHKSFDAEV